MAYGVQTTRFGLMSMFLSSALYMFESNVRSATILGIVGAGANGFQLSERIRGHRWEEACLILIVILVMVAIVDLISKQLRQRLIGGRQATWLVSGYERRMRCAYPPFQSAAAGENPSPTRRVRRAHRPTATRPPPADAGGSASYAEKLI